jgi:hypothetical protein
MPDMEAAEGGIEGRPGRRSTDSGGDLRRRGGKATRERCWPQVAVAGGLAGADSGGDGGRRWRQWERGRKTVAGARRLEGGRQARMTIGVSWVGPLKVCGVSPTPPRVEYRSRYLPRIHDKGPFCFTTF